MITAAQLRQARAALNLPQDEVIGACGISKATLSEIENEKSGGSASVIGRLQAFYEARGLVFTEDDGVRFNRSGLRRYQGAVEFRQFYDDIYETCRRTAGPVCIFNGVPDLLINHLGEEFYAAHAKRMAAIKDRFTFRVIIRENDQSLIGSSFVEYRWWPSELFHDRMMYVYGDKLAWIQFADDDVRVVVIEADDLADSQRVLFDIAWDTIARPVDV